MSAWPEAAWIVNQIKNDNQKNYAAQITQLAGDLAEWEAKKNTDYASFFSTVVRTELPQDSTMNFKKGSLCFLYQQTD